MDGQAYLEDAIHEFRRLRSLADRAMAQVGDGDYFRIAGAGSNSIAIVVKHIAGNMRSRWRDFLTTDGEKPDRNRDEEFEIRDSDSRESLTRGLDEGWRLLFEAVEPLGPEDLERTVTIRGEAHSVLQAIQRQLAHYAYHVGQIVFLARQSAGDAWESLSIPKGESVPFNQAPHDYLDPTET